MFDSDDEWPTVVLEECEGCYQAQLNQYERYRNKKWQQSKDEICSTEAPAEVDELFEGKGSKYLVLDLDELWNLKLHG